MALKRVFSAKNARQRTCLNCAREIPIEALKDDTVCTCAFCGQKMTVDRYGNTAILTLYERQDLRHRTPPIASPEEEKIKELQKELEEMRLQLQKEKEEAKGWQQAADDLAKAIEEARCENV